MKFLEMFIEDCKYYDLRNIEIKTILKNTNILGKTILDLGTGIGRLAFPLAKYAKKVVALDNDKRLREYFKKHKKRNLIFVNKKAENYLTKYNKFDIILLAWPTFNFKFVNLIKKVMHKNSKLIFITCDNNSDFETIVDKLEVVKKGQFDKDISNKIKFLKQLPKKFRLITKKELNTNYLYPNKKIAFRVIKNGIKMWFNIKLDKKTEDKLKTLIIEHKKREKLFLVKRYIFMY